MREHKNGMDQLKTGNRKSFAELQRSFKKSLEAEEDSEEKPQSLLSAQEHLKGGMLAEAKEITTTTKSTKGEEAEGP